MPYSYQLFIDGAWREGGAGDMPLIDPASEREIGRVARASSTDLSDALASARRAQERWAATPARERGAILMRAADIMRSKVQDAAKALSDEQGKLIAEAAGEYLRVTETLIWNGEQAVALTAPIRLDARRTLTPQPVGIVAAFTAWNYPAVLNARKLAAPLAAGCPVILKGAEETPSAAVFLVEAFVEAGLPNGVVNLVFGEPAEISAALLAATEVRMLTFTGSTAVGKMLAETAGRNLQRCVLELGGHSPVILFADADLDAAIPEIIEYKFECAGQSCNAPSRLLIERPIYDAVVTRIVAGSQALRIGAASDDGVDMGPMANGRRVEAMERLTRDALDRGATLLAGGARLERPGFFFPPTILADVPADALVLTEEPFGPILTVQPFDTVEEAITIANATDYGLASYVFTQDTALQTRMTDALSAGAISINHMKGVSADAPNAGVLDSGYGYEGGVEGFREFQSLKLVNRPAMG